MENSRTPRHNEHTESGPKNTGESLRPGLIALISGWSARRKWALGAIVCTVVIFALVLIQLGRFAGYKLLFGNLTHPETAAIASLLDDHNINYQIKNNGGAIWVPAKLIDSARLALAEKQLPEGSVINHQLLDEQGWQLTSLVQEVDRSALLQRELSRTISSLPPIASARVILTAGSPSNTEFEKSNPSASVFVSLLPGRALSQEYIKTIVHLLSASVYGLPAQNISIIDSQGSVLKDSSAASDGISASADILSYQQQVEKRLESRIQPLLDRILGNNRAIVKIAAEIDFSKTQKTLEIFDPVEPVVKSEHYIDEPAGVSGTGKNESTVTYEVSKTTSTTTSPVGRIERLTVSILVDQSIASDTVDPAQPALDKAMLPAIEKMLSGTISFNAERGDQLHLVTVPLGRPVDISATVESVPANLLYDYLPAARFGLVLIGFILLYILLIRPLIRTLASEFDKHRPAEERSLPDTFRAEQEPEQEYTALVQEEVLQNPSPAAHIIRKWIQDT